MRHAPYRPWRTSELCGHRRGVGRLDPGALDTRPVETSPVETSPVETRPVETSPVETRTVETSTVGTSPAEICPVETRTATPGCVAPVRHGAPSATSRHNVRYQGTPALGSGAGPTSAPDGSCTTYGTSPGSA